MSSDPGSTGQVTTTPPPTAPPGQPGSPATQPAGASPESPANALAESPAGALPERPAGAPPEPPAARRIPAERTYHGDIFVDDYAWLADKDNPDTIAYLEAENAYTEAITAGQAGLREAIFGEIKSRTQETDLTVPTRKGAWWYYTRTAEGKQYPVYCRCPAGTSGAAPPATEDAAPATEDPAPPTEGPAPATEDAAPATEGPAPATEGPAPATEGPAPATEDSAPPATEDAAPLPGEEVLLDLNELAGDSPFFSLGAFDVSPDGRLLAYATDFAGDERFTLRIKDLVTGRTAADEIPGTFYGPAWSKDASALFYVTVDDAWRPHRVWRHRVGTPASHDVIVWEERDERFRVGVGLARSERYLLISAHSSLTSEVRLLDATTPTAEPRVILPRRQGVEYSVEHQADPDNDGRLLILHNDRALNFELAALPLPGPAGAAPLASPADLTTVIAHRDDTRLLGVDAFADHLVIYFRREGLTGLRIIGADGSEREIAFPEPLYRVSPGENPEYQASSFRLHFVSLATPDSVYDTDTKTGELTLRKRRPVLSLPGASPYDPQDFEQHREWATAKDGTRIPISLIHRKGTRRDGSSPLLLSGYGSYEASADPVFSIPRVSLLDRGFVYAIAHVRGGGEMGRRWYDDGKILHKLNTFTDFVACAEHLVSQGWTAPERLIARGASAGGLLMGAAVNLAPQDFGGIVAQVPFVDALTSILDPSLPLTVTEWEEWGDPLHDAQVYAYIRAYSPYENISDQVYPPILALTSLNDTRVLYREPAKWIAKLRATARGGPFLLKTEMVAGHGGRSGRYDAWREESMILAWTITTANA